jgi:RHS repeat-associated protein
MLQKSNHYYKNFCYLALDINKNSGNIAQQVISMPNVSFTQTYKYDAIDRLVEAKETDTNGVENWQQTFNYDRFGNRIGRSQIIGSTTLTNNSQTLPNIDSNTNRFASGQGYLYDKTGNIKQDLDQNNNNQIRQFIFNGDNKQVHVKDANNVTIGTYYYDGNGRRVKKSTALETTIFVYDAGGILVAEYSTKLSPNPTVSYLSIDNLGTPRVITNKQGEVVSRRDYMPFGEDLFIGARATNTSLKYGNTDNVRQKFTGYQKDDETQLDFAEARYYSNQHGRFTAVDPLLASGKNTNPQTFNRFVYVGSNPLIRVDPDGLVWIVEHYKTSSGRKVTRPKWVNIAGSKDILWKDAVYKSWESLMYIAIDPNSSKWSKFSTFEAARAQYWIYTDFEGGLQDVFDGNWSASGLANTLLPTKDLAYMISYMKTGNVNGSLGYFIKIATQEGAGGAIGQTLFKFIQKTLGRVATSRFMKQLTKDAPDLAERLINCVACFTAGTQINTIDGLKPIEEIKVGDMVLSYDENTKTYEYKPVAQTFTAVKDNIVKLKIAGESKIFTTTTEHPFYVKIKKQYRARSNLSAEADGEWKTAEELKVGDKVLRPDGKWTRILEVSRSNKPTFVYNFEVEGNHNYFVGEKGVLSHNCSFARRALTQADLGIKKEGSDVIGSIALRDEILDVNIEYIQDVGGMFSIDLLRN